jgi:hypothetical protein
VSTGGGGTVAVVVAVVARVDGTDRGARLVVEAEVVDATAVVAKVVANVVTVVGARVEVAAFAIVVLTARVVVLASMRPTVFDGEEPSASRTATRATRPARQRASRTAGSRQRR